MAAFRERNVPQIFFSTPIKIGDVLIQCKNVSFNWPSTSKPIFSNIDVSIQSQSKISIIGENGVGKSTFLKLLVGEIKCTTGEIYRNPKMRVGYFSQHHYEQKTGTKNFLEQTPVEFLLSQNKTERIQTVRNFLGKFGIRGRLAINPISNLSGGQKSLVKFANIALQKPHILLLDEPTNHLDIQTIDSLITGLENYEGVIIFISHNQRLIDKVCDEIWIMSEEGKRLKRFEGTFKKYKRNLIQKMNTNDEISYK